MEQSKPDKEIDDDSIFSQNCDTNHGESLGSNKRRRSSIELRKVQSQIALDLSGTCQEDLFQEQEQLFQKEEQEQLPTTKLRRKKRLFHFNYMQNTCLKPRFSLQKQMILAFGTTITMTILVVMFVSFLVTVLTTNRVMSDSRAAIKNTTNIISKSSPRYVSEILTLKIPGEAVSLIEQAVMDRFAGYPYHAGYEDDSAVPFFDINSQRNVYPLNASSSLPLDWQIHPNVNDDNYEEHTQNRWSWYRNQTISTRSCAYLMQGMCDPSITSLASNDPTYFENCTDENNNLDTGGAVVPSPTNKHIARKAADLNFLLKSIYEQYQDVRDIGVYFANAGAGSALYFPHYLLNSSSTYESIGCEWMSQPNPYNVSRPIATEEEIKRCRPNGSKVNSRTFNVLEKDWCRQMALDPFRNHIILPLLDEWGGNFWYSLIGKAVYDRLTNEFIACIGLTVSFESIKDIVASVKILHNEDDALTKVTLVKWDEEGTVLTSPDWDLSSATETTTIDDASLGIGLTKHVFQEIKNLVNFTEKWDPELAREKFEEYNYETGDMLISAYPLPGIPEKYTKDYDPQFIVILSMNKMALEKSLPIVGDKSSNTERKMYIIITVCGVSGLVISFLFILLASNYLTKPLAWMNKVSEHIVDQFGRFDNEAIDHARPVVSRCTPKTELSTLMEEFQKMISRFSGKGSAKVEENKLIEIKNNFNLFEEFKELYFSRMERGYKFNYNASSSASNTISEEGNGTIAESSGSLFIKPRRCYLGQNIVKAKVIEDSYEQNPKSVPVKKHLVYSSPLFWWIMGLIVTPLLVTTVTISSIVTWRLSKELTSLSTTVEDLYIDLGKDYISSSVMLRSNLTESVTKHGVRELQILNRVANWLLFGGVERSRSFTEMLSPVEECKNFEPGACPHLKNKTAAPCDCEWEDNRSMACYSYDQHSRYLQKQMYSVENNQDTWPNGDRNSTSFPAISSSPTSTTWLDNVANAPGFNKDLSAEGYGTTYDRMGVMSALSVIQIPLFNHYKKRDRSLSTYVAFEADGMLLVYDGCSQKIAGMSFWSSTKENNASAIRPELCPIGKYGFDSRCREWYGTGKRKWKESSPDASPLHVTSPYFFAATEDVGQTCTLPIADSITKQYIGQTGVDFSPESAFRALNIENTPLSEGGFPFVIKADGGTVIGPGFTKVTNDILPPIEELVTPYDEIPFDGDCTNTEGFEKILCDMKAGKHGTTEFTRLKNDLSSETMYISYAPVNLKNCYPVDSSDFSRGVETYETMIYSIALVIPKPTFFGEITDDLNGHLNIAIAIFCALIVIGTAWVTFLLSRVTVSITTPMLHLLEEIKKINRREVHNSSLRFTMESGSKDMQNICNTFQTLFLVVHLANSAYFSGELEVAHKVLVSTLSAFRRIQNKKAIGVASNNLGNIMLAMYRILLSSGDDEICGLNKQQIISNGTKYFLQAIKVGEETYDKFYEEEGWSKNCLAFMQHLSNRYFNRAVFLLTVQKDHETPDLAKQMAFRDLQIVFDMDIEVADQCIEMGIVRSKKEHFETVMSRVRGLLELLSSYPDEWNVEELLDDALKLLKTVINNPTNDLFSTLGPAGRMQQLDCQLINYIKKTKDGLSEAARIAIRMLVEDEYILSDAYMVAIGTIIEYTESEIGMECFDDRAAVMRELFAARTSPCIQKEVIVRQISSEASKRLKNITPVLQEGTGDESKYPTSVYECNRGDVTMETF